MNLIDSFWTKTSELAKSALPSFQVPGFGQSSETSSGLTGGSTDPYLENRKYTVRIYQNENVVVGAVPETIEINQSASWNAPWAGGIGGTKGDILALGLGTRLVAQVLTLQVWQGGGNNDFDFSIQFELRAYADEERDVMIPLRTLLAMTMPSLSSNGFLQAPGPQLTQKGIRDLGAGATDVLVKTGEVVGREVKQTASDLLSSVLGTKKERTKDGEATSLTDRANAAVNDISATAKQAGLSRRGIEANMENKISIEIGDWFRLSNIVVTDVRHTLKAQRPGVAEGTLQAADVLVSFRPMFTLTREDIDLILGKRWQPRRKGL